jgi:hypothetical protein
LTRRKRFRHLLVADVSKDDAQGRSCLFASQIDSDFSTAFEDMDVSRQMSVEEEVGVAIAPDIVYK